MRQTRSVLAITALLALASCDLVLSSFQVPTQVGPGQLFEVDLIARGDGMPLDPVGVILQLPMGFSVEAATALVTAGGVTSVYADGGLQAIPSTLVLPEPGHHVVTFAGAWWQPVQYGVNTNLKVYVRAPSTAGTFPLKIALFGTNGVQPAGATSFAAITAAPFVQTVTVLGQPILPFRAQVLPAQLPLPTYADGVALGDVDGDGRSDLLCFASGPGLPRGTAVWLNRSTGAWPALHPPATTFVWGRQHVAFGDFDGDGHLDVVDGSGRVLFGDGGTRWTPGPVLPLLIPEWAGVAVGDIDGDGRDDIALSARMSDAVQVFRSGPNRTFADWSGNLPNATNGPSGSQQLAIADLNGDGHGDLVASGWIGLRVWLGNGLGQWTDISAGLPFATDFALGDLDANGLTDLVFGSGTAVNAIEYAGGAWQQRSIPVPGAWFRGPLVLVDYNRDGWLDICFGTTLLENLAGLSFGPPVVLFSSQSQIPLQGIATGDLDGDTWPDLVVTYDGLPPVLLLNLGSGLSPYGHACTAPGFTAPRTVGIGQPTLGNANFAIGLDGATPNGFGLLWLGLHNRFAFGTAQLPFGLAPFGAPGCAVFASTESPAFVFANAQGHAILPMPIPNAAALQRVVLFAQGAAAAPGANALGWLFANGLAVKIP